MIFVDTNFFLRFLLGDNNKQSQLAKNLFEEGALGQKKLFTSMIVCFEVYWVLASFYKKDKKALVGILNDIMQMSFIKLKDRKCLAKAIEIYRKTNLDLEDAFNLAYAQQNKAADFATFDQKLLRSFQNTRL